MTITSETFTFTRKVGKRPSPEEIQKAKEGYQVAFTEEIRGGVENTYARRVILQEGQKRHSVLLLEKVPSSETVTGDPRTIEALLRGEKVSGVLGVAGGRKFFVPGAKVKGEKKAEEPKADDAKGKSGKSRKA